MNPLINALPRLSLLYLATLFALVSVDPGLVSLFRSLAYDLNEGQSIVMRVLVLGCSAGIVMLPLLLHGKLKVILYLSILLPLMVTGQTFRLVNGEFSSWEAGLIVNEFGFAGGAIIAFGNQVTQATVTTLLVLILLYLLRVPVLRGRVNAVLMFSPWVLPVIYLLFAQGGYWSRHFVLPVKVPSNLAYELLNPIPISTRERVNIPVSDTKPPHILYLVDESIRGDLLSINNQQERTTPRLSSLITRHRAYNYGVVSSVANCSAQSNLLLRTGLRPGQLPDRQGALFSQANLFQYAHKAGMETHYLDAQVKGQRLQNFFTHQEIEQIDHYWPLKNHLDLDEHLLDQELLDSIIERVSHADKPLFIYANKVGTHFPYQETYPNPDPSHDKAEHYRAALRWAVDRFLDRLITGLQHSGQAVQVIYTSDHGQGLGEGGSHSTHCLPKDPVDVQARVPLIMFSLNLDLPAQWQPENGFYSQFQLFPTVLQMMGYEADAVIDRYGTDLSGPWRGRRIFYSGDLSGRGQLSKNHFKHAAQQRLVSG